MSVGGGGPDIQGSRTYLKCRLFPDPDDCVHDSHVGRVTKNIVEGDRWRTRHNWKDGIALDLREFCLGSMNCI